jgi:hypothetical protein
MTSKPNNPAPAPAGAFSQSADVPPYVIEKNQKSNMIRKLLYYGYQMGYDQPRTELEKRALLSKQQLCWNHVQAWCKSKHCKIRKTLNRYTAAELTEVVSQFEQVYKSFLQQLKQQEP